MKNYFLLLIAFLVITTTSCESSDEPLDVKEPEPSTEFSNLQIMSYTEDFFQIEIQDGDVTYNNLSQSLGVPNSFKHINYDDPSLEIFTGIGDDYSLYQKNLETEESKMIKGFCANERDVRSKYGFIHNERYFLINDKYLSQSENFQLFLNLYEEEETNCTQILLTDFYYQEIQAIKQNQYLIVYFKDAQYKNRLLIYNLNDLEIVIEKEFPGSYYAICRDNEIEVVTSNTATIYKYEDFSEKSKRDFDSYFPIQPLIENSKAYNNKIIIERNTAGPSNFTRIPLILDLETGEAVDIDFNLLNIIQTNLNNNKNYPVTIESYRIDLKKEKIAIGYQLQDKNEYGLMWLEYNGEIIKDIPLEHLPQMIFLD